MNMDILMVGAGGREHTLIRKLKENKSIKNIYCAPGNGGISRDAQCVNIAATDVAGVVAFAKEMGVDLVFVAPDDPLMLGMVDSLEKEGIKAFGPRKAAAEIEGSKVFAKDLMKKYGIPTAKYEVFDSSVEALEYIKGQNTYPVVVKADGLALGKGVIIAESYDMAAQAIHSIMEDKIFGASGNRVVIEEYLEGPEVSVLAFTDGKSIKPMVSSMDHKRVYDGDKGPNTGGMGTISPNPFYTEEVANQCMEQIFIPTIKALNSEGRTFKGCLFFGLMITKDGPKVIEYNARFGDPETQVVLSRLKTDLLTVVLAVIDENLDSVEIEFSDEAAACVVMASGGYPQSYEKGKKIVGLDEKGQLEGAEIFHAGTKYENGQFYTAGGRVLGVTACGTDLDEALDKAYSAVDKISFEGAHYRRDIGMKKY